MPLVKFLLRHALLFYFSCALLTAALMVLATGVISQYELVEKGVQIRGVVVEPDCGRHLSFSYRFPVAGATYAGQSVSDHCVSVRAGAAVTVHYVPGDPSVNTAEDPGYLFRNSRDMILLAALTAPAFLLLIFKAQLRVWKRAGTGLKRR